MIDKTCCFFGHRTVEEPAKIRTRVRDVVTRLIEDEQVDTFLFGSRSDFNTLCHEVVTELKGQYPHLRRIYVRAEYPAINDRYRAQLLLRYEDTCFPAHLARAGAAVYLERNRYMIDHSRVCVVYYREAYTPPRNRRTAHLSPPHSGTRDAYFYAARQNRRIINTSTEDS